MVFQMKKIFGVVDREFTEPIHIYEKSLVCMLQIQLAVCCSWVVRVCCLDV